MAIHELSLSPLRFSNGVRDQVFFPFNFPFFSLLSHKFGEGFREGREKMGEKKKVYLLEEVGRFLKKGLGFDGPCNTNTPL